MWIDGHCHLSDLRIYADAGRIIEESMRAGVGRFLLGGFDPADWDRQRELQVRFTGRCYSVYGLHPWWVHETLETARDEAEADRRLSEGLLRLREKAGECFAIGETGLDGARGRFKVSRQFQQRAFEAQLKLAAEFDKALVLHVVRAHPMALQTLEEPRFSRLRGMIHSFSGTLVDARRYLDRGWMLSFSARITFPEARELQAVLKSCPPDRLVFETDSPDQPPAGHEDKNHTPVSLLKVVEKAALIRNEAVDDLMTRSRENLARVFYLPL